MFFERYVYYIAYKQLWRVQNENKNYSSVWGFVQIEQYSGLKGNSKFDIPKYSPYFLIFLWNIFGINLHWMKPIFSHISTLNHDCLTYIWLQKSTKFGLRILSQFCLSVAMWNPHKRWQHTANVRTKFFKSLLTRLANWLPYRKEKRQKFILKCSPKIPTVFKCEIQYLFTAHLRYS